MSTETPPDHDSVHWHADVGSRLAPVPVGGPDSVYARGDVLYALDPDDGSERWTYANDILDSRSRHVLPALHDGVVYAAFGSLEHERVVDGVDVTSGQRVWRFVPDLRTVVLAGVTDDAVYVGSIGGAEGQRDVFAVETDDGTHRWHRKLAGTLDGSVANAGDVVVLATKDGTYGLDAATGETQWTADLESPGSRPVVRDETVYGALDGNLVALDGRDGSVRWQRTGLTFDRYRWALAGDAVYGVTRRGTAFAVDAATGDIAWQTTIPTRWSHSLLVPGDGRTYVVGKEQVLALDAGTGERRWQRRTDGTGEPRTLVAGERTLYVVLEDPEALWALDTTTGTERWRVPFDDRVSRPVVRDGTMVVGTVGGSVYGLGP